MTKLFENAIESIRPNDDALQSKLPTEYDMSLEATAGLIEMAMEGDIFYAVHYAFLFGFVMGNRATIRRKLKRL